ncbi:MAG TPA: hypothetical protein VHA56_16110 [Mucilaginibacter sp.]|nr:hypothetical protein [Mucilaginibacter sp.]
MTAIEHQQIRGITVKNIIVTIVSFVTVTASVMTTYYSLRDDIKDVRATQETTNRVNEIRLKLLESHVALLEQEFHELKERKDQ